MGMRVTADVMVLKLSGRGPPALSGWALNPLTGTLVRDSRGKSRRAAAGSELTGAGSERCGGSQGTPGAPRASFLPGPRPPPRADRRRDAACGRPRGSRELGAALWPRSAELSRGVGRTPGPPARRSPSPHDCSRVASGRGASSEGDPGPVSKRVMLAWPK